MKTPTLHQSLQAKLGVYTGEHLTATIRYQDRYGNHLRLERVRLFETPNCWADALR